MSYLVHVCVLVSHSFRSLMKLVFYLQSKALQQSNMFVPKVICTGKNNLEG